MDAATLPLKVYRGMLLEASWQFLDSAGDPRPFAGWTAVLEVRPTAGGDLWLRLTSADAAITLGAADGWVTVTGPSSVTATIPEDAAEGRWDLLLIDDDDEPHRWLEGPATIRDPISQVSA
jgi:hypothetical protein